MDQSYRLEKTKLRCRVTAQNLSIAGHVSTVHRRLIDLLNVEHSDNVMIEDVLMQAVPGCSSGSERAEYACVYTSSILFAVPLEDTAASARPPDPLTWIRKRAERAKAVVGPYEIVGDVYVAEGSNLKDTLLGRTDRFLALAKAVICRVDDPTFSEEHEVILLNRHRADFIMPAAG